MSYLYQYKLVLSSLENLEKIDNLLTRRAGYHIRENVFSEPFTWRSFEKDFQEISKMFPEATFKVFVSGENVSDFWVAVFKNGQEIKERRYIS